MSFQQDAFQQDAFQVQVPGFSGAVGLAAETDTALALGAVKLRLVGNSTETDTALGLSKLKIKATGLAAETDSALGLGAVKLRLVGVATETDTALALDAIGGGGAVEVRPTAGFGASNFRTVRERQLEQIRQEDEELLVLLGKLFNLG